MQGYCDSYELQYPFFVSAVAFFSVEYEVIGNYCLYLGIERLTHTLLGIS